MKSRQLSITVAVLATLAISPYAQAASVQAVSGDAKIMNTLGKTYIHSRHTGTMPYWGPCYRCKSKIEDVPTCNSSEEHQVLATWTNSGDSSCGGYETDTFTAETECSTSGQVILDLVNTSYDPASTTSTHYGITVPIAYSGSSDVNQQAVFGGGNTCSQNFDWYPTYSIHGDDADGTFNGSVSFGNYLSPSQYYQSPSFPIVFQNYEEVKVKKCKEYPPTSSECAVPPPASQTSLPVYSWNCDTQETGWNADVCSNASISESNAEWIFGAADGDTGTAQSGYSVMQSQYVNPTSDPMPATLVFAADNYGWVWINGQQVAFTKGFSQLSSVNITLAPGTNTIDFMVMNAPDSPSTDPNEFANPSAGILAITNSSGENIMGSNSGEWVLEQNPPSTPDPSPSSLLSGTGYTAQNCYDGGC